MEQPAGTGTSGLFYLPVPCIETGWNGTGTHCRRPGSSWCTSKAESRVGRCRSSIVTGRLFCFIKKRGKQATPCECARILQQILPELKLSTMKRTFLTCFYFLTMAPLFATIIPISVTNNQFNPASVNVTVGDTVRYNFIGTFPHNATTVAEGPRAGVVPAGAANINSGPVSNVVPRSYDYKVTVPGNYRYYCTQHSPDGVAGMVGFIIASGPVPANLKNLNARFERNVTNVSWETLTEQNVDYFAVKRSFNGIEFNELTRVKATGNSTTLQSYQFTDKSISNSHTYIYYSLATVDRDGKQSLSPIVMVKNPVAVRKLITSLSPNPISKPGHLMLQFNADGVSKLYAAVYNAAGKKVLEDDMNGVLGLNNGHLHLGDIPAGIYNIVFTLGKLRETHRVVVK